MQHPPSASTPRITRMLRELEGAPREAANDGRDAEDRGPRRFDSLVPVALTIGGALFIALAAWQAWQLTAGYDARLFTEATSRQ